MTDRPSELFAKYYDNDEPIFNSNFGDSDRMSKYAFKSPLRTSKRSLSPFNERMMSIVEENEQEDNLSDGFGGKARPSMAPIPIRYSSQTRLSEVPGKRNGVFSRSDNSHRSLSRLTDNFYGFNRYTNQPSQKNNQRAILSNFMQEEIVRLSNYNKIKSETKKKSLAEIIDEGMHERDSIYFNPDNEPLSVKEHNFEGETPIFHSRATFDPYDIAPAQGRMTSSNNFNFKEDWDIIRRTDNQNLTFGSTQKKGKKFDYATSTRQNKFSPFKPTKMERNTFEVGSQMTSFDIERKPLLSRKSKSKLNKTIENETNPKLSKISTTYYDDNDRKVMQRFYLLIHGDPTAIHFQFSLNIFK